MRLCGRHFCTGCAACVNICPVGAITLVVDAEGFLRPKISNDRCVLCGKCTRVCPQVTPVDIPTEPKRVFACWHKDRVVRRKSTSGGAFTALAEEVLSCGGKVYGAAFERFPRVAHISIDSVSELKRFQGSKYVQSEIGRVFVNVKEDLSNGRRVLFSGTPCQIAGLYAYLGGRYEMCLTTVDLVCHGVPSPKVFADYVKWLENKYGATVTSYRFRDKKIGWYLHSTAICFSDGRILTEHFFKNPFSRGFLRDLFVRPSCHYCAYAGTGRPADITLSDFWRYKGKRKDGRDRDDDKGVSMVMLNTSAGAKLFDSARERLVVWERGLDDAVVGNPALRAPFPPSQRREQFWHDYRHLPFEMVLEKYMYSENLTKWLEERYTWYGKLRLFLRRVFGKCKGGAKKIYRIIAFSDEDNK